MFLFPEEEKCLHNFIENLEMLYHPSETFDSVIRKHMGLLGGCLQCPTLWFLFSKVK